MYLNECFGYIFIGIAIGLLFALWVSLENAKEAKKVGAEYEYRYDELARSKNEEIYELRQKLADIEKENKDLESDNHDYKIQISELEEQVERQEYNIEELEDELREYKTRS